MLSDKQFTEEEIRTATKVARSLGSPESIIAEYEEQADRLAAQGRASEVVHWKPEKFLAEVLDGDDVGWTAQLSWLWREHPERMSALLNDINFRGIWLPVSIGYDTGSDRLRVWDGHHRIAAAVALHIPIPTLHSNLPPS